MTLPFPGQVDWHAFALFRSIDSKVELQNLLQNLIRQHEQNPAALRQRRLALSKKIGLFVTQDRRGCTDAERASFAGLLLGELRARQAIWPHLRVYWVPQAK